MRRKLLALSCAGLCVAALAVLASAWPRVEAGGASANVETVFAGTVAEPADVRYEGFEVEVLVYGRPVEQYLARGRRYVEALRGAEYELRIRNPLGVRVAVALSVDGLNTIDARRSPAWNASKWVIGPYQTITIRGWQMSSARARQFYFTTERDSYGAKLGQTANLGVISAVFFRERTPVTVVPPPRPYEDRDRRGQRDESGADAPSSAPETSAGANSAKSRRADVYPQPDDEAAATGIGRNVRNDVRWVNMDLDSRPAAEVNVRYEYREGLIKLGIIPRPSYPYPDPTDRRERSTGFEDRRYSPEP